MEISSTLPRASFSACVLRQLRTAALLALAFPPAVLAQVDGDLNTWTCTGHCGTRGAGGDVGLSPVGSAQYGYVTTNGSQAHQVSPLNIVESGGGGSTFTQTNGSAWLSAPFALTGAQAVDVWFNYVSTDGKGFDDYAWARLVNAGTGATAAWLFTARSTNSNKQNIVPGDVVDRQDFDPDVVIVDYANFDFNTRNTAPGGQPIDWEPLGIWNGTCWRDKAEGCGFTGWLHSHLTPGAGSYRLQVGVVNFGDEIYDSGLAFDLQSLSAPVPEPASWLMLAAGLTWLRAGRGRRHSSLPRSR